MFPNGVTTLQLLSEQPFSLQPPSLQPPSLQPPSVQLEDGCFGDHPPDSQVDSSLSFSTAKAAFKSVLLLPSTASSTSNK